MKLVKGGWAVPCRIAYDSGSGMWETTIDDAVTMNIDPVQAGVFKVWLVGKFIAEWEYLDMVNRREWARSNQPDHPCLHPRKAIDPNLLRPIRMPSAGMTGR